MNAEAAAAADVLRRKVFDLEIEIVEMRKKYELARGRISELMAPHSPNALRPPPSPDPVRVDIHDDDRLDWQELLDSLAEHPGDHNV